MKTCKKCHKQFKTWAKIEGVNKCLGKRRYCLECSPWGQKNSIKLDKYLIINDIVHKKCATCKEFLPKSLYHKGPRINNKEYMQGSCKICHNSRTKQKAQKAKSKAILYKGNKCNACKMAYPQACYDFHHLDPTQKDFKLSDSKVKNMCWAKIALELDKCVLLCANCHRLEHAL